MIKTIKYINNVHAYITELEAEKNEYHRNLSNFNSNQANSNKIKGYLFNQILHQFLRIFIKILIVIFKIWKNK